MLTQKWLIKLILITTITSFQKNRYELFKTITLKKNANFKIKKEIQKFKIALNLKKSEKLLDIRQNIINENLMHCDNYKIFADLEKKNMNLEKKNFRFYEYDKRNQFLTIFTNSSIELFSILKNKNMIKKKKNFSKKNFGDENFENEKDFKVEKFNNFLESEIEEKLFFNKKENFFYFKIFENTNLGLFIWNSLIIVKNVITGKTHFLIKGEFLINKKNKVILFSNFGDGNLGFGIFEKKRNKIFIYKLSLKKKKIFITQILDLENLKDFSKKNEINLISIYKEKMKINIIYVLIEKIGLFKYKEISNSDKGKFLYDKKNFQYIKGKKIFLQNKKIFILENKKNETNLKIYNFYEQNSNLFIESFFELDQKIENFDIDNKNNIYLFLEDKKIILIEYDFLNKIKKKPLLEHFLNKNYQIIEIEDKKKIFEMRSKFKFFFLGNKNYLIFEKKKKIVFYEIKNRNLFINCEANIFKTENFHKSIFEIFIIDFENFENNQKFLLNFFVSQDKKSGIFFIIIIFVTAFFIFLLLLGIMLSFYLKYENRSNIYYKSSKAILN